MANPFSRTTRAIQVDNFYVSLIGLSVATILALAWGWWFFKSEVTMYETSQAISVTNKESLETQFVDDGPRTKTFRKRIVTANFQTEALQRIRPGQGALLRLDGRLGKQAGAIPAIVLTVDRPDGKRLGKVELLTMMDADAPNPFETGIGGEVKVEVEYVTPAILVMRASGMFVDTPPTSYSPQKLPETGRTL